jgi:hypothetical protein
MNPPLVKHGISGKKSPRMRPVSTKLLKSIVVADYCNIAGPLSDCVVGMFGHDSRCLSKCQQLLRDNELGIYSAIVKNNCCDMLSVLCLIVGNTTRKQKSS